MAIRDDLLDGSLSRPHLEAIEKERAERFRQRLVERRAGKVQAPRRLKVLPGKPPARGKTILVIGDAHAHPDYLAENVRFSWLGRMAADLEPDVVVDIGDFWDFPSLFGFERRGAPRELGRYWRDVEAGVDARERIDHEIRHHRRRDDYFPRLVSVTGNHEERIQRAGEAIPALKEAWGYHDLQDDLFGWERAEYGEPIEIESIQFVHYPFSTKGYSFGQVHAAAQAVFGKSSKVGGGSSVFGHTHRRDIYDWYGHTAVNVGMYFNFIQDWLPAAEQDRWWAGLTVLRDVRDGKFDVDFVGIDEVRRRYA